MKRYIVAGVVVAFVLVIAGYLLFVPGAASILGAKTEVTNPIKIAQLTVGFVENPYPDDYNVMRIPGWVENLSNKRIISADLEIQLLDSDGNRKELIKYTVNDIASGARKTFDANGGAFSGPRNSKVKIVRLVVAQ